MVGRASTDEVGYRSVVSPLACLLTFFFAQLMTFFAVMQNQVGLSRA